MGRGQQRAPRSHPLSTPLIISRSGSQRELGNMPQAGVLQGLGLETMDNPGQQQQEGQNNPFAPLIPWLTSLSAGGNQPEKMEQKPARYLVAKGLPTLPTKLVEKVWNLEYVEMDEFLPSPRSLRIAEQGNSSHSLQDSLVGALNEFQATQRQRSQRRVMDITTWVRCFTLYMAVLSEKAPKMVSSMVAHLHTVLRLQQKASYNLAWLEYDIQFRMELAASANREWTCGDPWQYVTCLPPHHTSNDPFEFTEVDTPPGTKGKGKRPPDQDGEKGGARPPTKKPKKGVCRLHNTAAGGCPYGRECIFIHRCTGCGATDEHGRVSCPAGVAPTGQGRGGNDHSDRAPGLATRK